MRRVRGLWKLHDRKQSACVNNDTNRQSVGECARTESVSHGDDGPLLDDGISCLIGEHHSQMWPPVSPFFTSAALGGKHHDQNSFFIKSRVLMFWLFYRGHSGDSPRQQLEDGLEGIAGRQLACEPARRALFFCHRIS